MKFHDYQKKVQKDETKSTDIIFDYWNEYLR
jgi:hypothetical protein